MATTNAHPIPTAIGPSLPPRTSWYVICQPPRAVIPILCRGSVLLSHRIHCLFHWLQLVDTPGTGFYDEAAHEARLAAERGHMSVPKDADTTSPLDDNILAVARDSDVVGADPHWPVDSGSCTQVRLPPSSPINADSAVPLNLYEPNATGLTRL